MGIETVNTVAIQDNTDVVPDRRGIHNKIVDQVELT